MADLIRYIEEWIQEGNPFPVQLQLLTVDTSCSVGIDSFIEPECRAGSETTRPTTDNGIASDITTPASGSTGVIVGAVAAIVFMLLIMTVTVAIVVVVRRKRQASLDLNDLK